MAYDTAFEKRIDQVVQELEMRFKKKKMFGGLAYFAKGGNMAFAIRDDELLFRIHEGEADSLIDMPGIHAAIMGDRLMENWLQAGGEAINASNLPELLTIGYDYAMSLPPKQ